MKRISRVLTVVMLTALSLFVSCDNSMQVSDGIASVRFASGTEDGNARSLSRVNPVFEAENLYWMYTAKKVDNSGLSTGEVLTPTTVGTDGKLTSSVGPFSLGDWEFTLYAYTDSIFEKLAYKGSTTARLVKSDSGNSVSVTVSAMKTSGGTGYIAFPEKGGISLTDSNGNAVTSYKELITITDIENPEITSTYADSSSRTFELASGAYKVTVAYCDVDDDNLKYGENSIYVNVWDNLTTTIGGSLDEITSDTTFNPSDGTVEASVTATISDGSKTTIEVASSPANLDSTDSEEKTTVEIPAGATESGSATLTVTPYTVEKVGDFIIEAEQGKTVVGGLDLKLEVEGQTIDTFSSAVTVTTYVAKGLDEEELEIKYNGTGEQPTLVSYNSTSGELVFTTTHFSAFYVSTSYSAYIVETNTAYKKMSSAVEDIGTDNVLRTIRLLRDATEPGFIVSSGKNIVVDLDGHTYDIDGTVGSSGTETNGFQLLRDSTVYFKNGNVNLENGSILFQNYSNLTIEDVSASNTYGYVISNNNGSLTLKGNTNITAPSGKVAFDVYYWPKNGYVDGVTVTIDETFTGTIDGKIEYASDGIKDDYAEKAKLYIKSGNFKNFSIETKLLNPSIFISGGVFDQKPESKYLAKNYIAIERDGKFIVEKYDGIVIRSEEDFEKIELNPIISNLADPAANNLNGKYILANDIDVEHFIYIGPDSEVVLDLNGYKIESQFDGFSIGNWGKMTINDNSVGKTGIVCNSSAVVDSNFSHDAIRNYGTLIINGGTFGDNDTNIENANTEHRGAALRSDSGEVEINGGFFTAGDNYYSWGSETGYTYAIRVLSGTLTINDCTLYGAMNGGIASENFGSVVIKDGNFSVTGNKSYYVLVTGGLGEFTVNGGTFIKKNGPGHLLGGFDGMPSWDASSDLEGNGYHISGGKFIYNENEVTFERSN